ncbi:PilN domain-containing protein, partial [Selenomonas noxia]
ASYEQAQRACTQAEEELALRGADLRRMEEFSAMHRDAVQHEQAWMTFAAASSPLRALLVHLGAAAADGIRLTGITTSAERVRIEGEAESYESLSAAIRRMEEQKFFSSDLMPAYAGQEGAEDGRIRFVLETHW